MIKPIAGILAALMVLGLLQGCANSQAMDLHVPHACHGSAAPFHTYRLSFVDVPGFIEGVIATSVEGALAAQGLDEAANPDEADVAVVNTFFLIDRNPPPQQFDPMGERVQTSTVNRFITHLKVDVVDRRTDSIIWTGSMYRPHAIQGGETFHNEQAVLIIRKAYDDMFVGLTTPCR